MSTEGSHTAQPSARPKPMAPARSPALEVAGATATAVDAPPISDREFSLFQTLIYREAGIHLPPAKKALLVRRLSKRLKALGLTSFSAYYRHVTGAGGHSERIRMLDCVATNETSFFREPRQFALLEQSIIPQWKEAAETGRRARRIRVWSAACSTGQEPFSLAMVLLHHLPPDAGWEVEILASDISTRALAAARSAVWPIEKVREIPERFLREFMLQGRRRQLGRIKAGPQLRLAVRFQRLNLHLESYPALGSFDLILCRNVLIYFDSESRLGVLDRLLRHLSPDGYLFVGHAESLTNLSSRVRTVIPTVYQPAGERRPRSRSSFVPSMQAVRRPPPSSRQTARHNDKWCPAEALAHEARSSL